MERSYKTRREFNVRLEARLKNGALVNARASLNKTAKAIAQEIGVSYELYLSCEGMKHYPSFETQRKICEYFREKGICLLEDEVFPEQLRHVDPSKTKYVSQRQFPPESLISLSRVGERLLPSRSYVDETIERENMQEVIGKVISDTRKLSPRARHILKSLYGIGVPQISVRELAAELGIKESAVNQAHRVAIQKLRESSPSLLNQLKELL